jgi:hypothetical protein
MTMARDHCTKAANWKANSHADASEEEFAGFVQTAFFLQIEIFVGFVSFGWNRQ